MKVDMQYLLKLLLSNLYNVLGGEEEDEPQRHHPCNYNKHTIDKKSNWMNLKNSKFKERHLLSRVSIIDKGANIVISEKQF